jgi:uracil-DNA glycosylase
MTGTDPTDPRAELAELAGDLRRALVQLRRGGVFGAPGGASPRGGLAVAGDEPGAADQRPDHIHVHDHVDGAAGVNGTVDGRLALPQIREVLGDCQRCKLGRTRTSIAFGVGAADAALMFIGEAPGAEEDRRGEPFVGAAGQLLDKMIAAMGWSRDTVYIANVLKCRPPGNRDPEPDEVAACAPFLARQIEAIAPRVIVTLGKPAAHALLGTSAPISALRGRWHDHRGVRVMPTFHPAFLLRQPDRKREAWSDLKLVIDELSRLGVVAPSPPRG